MRDDSAADVPLGASGSSAPRNLPPSALELSLLEAVLQLSRHIEESNLHLVMLVDQNSKVLANIAVLMDLILTDNDDENMDTSRAYLDGSPII